ncbi:MAG: hypothetical protein J6N76_07270 [Lachnospiraceae bacterium]|nr:hypothetical protein [Lachnospiraceae bacterium]
MSSIYHGAFVTTDEEEVVIDSNDLMQEKIAAYEEKMEKRRQKLLLQRMDDFLELLDKDDEGNPVLKRDEEGNIILPADEEGNPLIPVDEDGNIVLPTDEEGNPLLAFNAEGYPVSPDEVFTEGITGEDGEIEYDPDDPGALLTGRVVEKTPEEIIEEAKNEAEQIIAEAMEQAEALKAHAEAEGEKAGFMEGQNKAIAELSAQRDELEQERIRLNQEFETRQADMERELVTVITDVVRKVFCARVLDDCEDIILHLSENVLSNVNSSKEFLIKVNEENRSYINEHKEELLSKVGSDVTLDIIADPLLSSEECIIETDGGIFDCSIGVEMENLIKEIRSLAV